MDDIIGINNPLWYVCVLLICYVWYWLLLRLADQVNVNQEYLFMAMMILGIGIIDSGISWPFLRLSSGRGYLGFFGGMILHHIYYGNVSKKVLKNISAVVLGLCLFAWFVDAGELFDNMRMLLVFMIYPAMIVFTLSSKILGKILNRRFWGYLGKISFEMYVWHAPVMSTAGKIAYAVGYTPLYTYGTMFLFALLMIVFSSVLYFRLEQPLSKIIIASEEKVRASV